MLQPFLSLQSLAYCSALAGGARPIKTRTYMDLNVTGFRQDLFSSLPTSFAVLLAIYREGLATVSSSSLLAYAHLPLASN